MAISITDAPYEINIAERLDQEVLDEIGNDLLEKIQNDDDSRAEWLEQNDEWMRLAAQIREDKNWPWPNASNVKYPLLSTAALQFHARVFPTLLNNDHPAKTRVLGEDPNGEKAARAERTSSYMSYQLLEEMDEWVDDMDRALFILPITGLVYKKTYYSEALGRAKSVMILPRDLIINYYAPDMERARKTHVIDLDQNEFQELVNQDIFLDVDLTVPESKQNEGTEDEIIPRRPTNGDEATYTLYESHCWLDLDEDGYKEPYIVVLDDQNGQVVRITARWNEEDIEFRGDDVVKIAPEEYFTPYIFLPDPNSSIYGIGFGTLLGPLNEAANTMINQLVDAGTLSNLQGGFLGRGIKMKGGATRFVPGEWKIVNNSGDDLKKNIFPLPVKEPSNVLFSLLGMVIDSGQRLASVTDMMVGENPGQNQPATTSMAVLEQGLKVFTGIYKRIYRAFGKELKRIYKLNGEFLDGTKYFNVLDKEGVQQIAAQDFNTNDFDVVPAADPSVISDAQKMLKAQALLDKMSMGLPLNPQVVTKKVLEAEGHTEIEQLMNIQPQPDPEMQLKQREQMHQEQQDKINAELEAEKVRAEVMKDMANAILSVSKAESEEAGTQLEYLKTYIENLKTQEEAIDQRLQSLMQQNQARQSPEGGGEPQTPRNRPQGPQDLGLTPEELRPGLGS